MGLVALLKPPVFDVTEVLVSMMLNDHSGYHISRADRARRRVEIQLMEWPFEGGLTLRLRHMGILHEMVWVREKGEVLGCGSTMTYPDGNVRETQHTLSDDMGAHEQRILYNFLTQYNDRTMTVVERVAPTEVRAWKEGQEPARRPTLLLMGEREVVKYIDETRPEDRPRRRSPRPHARRSFKRTVRSGKTVPVRETIVRRTDWADDSGAHYVVRSRKELTNA